MDNLVVPITPEFLRQVAEKGEAVLVPAQPGKRIVVEKMTHDSVKVRVEDSERPNRAG